MTRSHTIARCTIVFALALGNVSLTGCEDENSPKTWVAKLPDDARRVGATTRLHQLFDSTMATASPPGNVHDAKVVAFLNDALPGLVTSFKAHPDDVIARKEAIEVLAQSQDARAIPALVSALSFRAGNADSERIALRATQAIKDMAETFPAAERARTITALITLLDRAEGGSGPLQIRYNAVNALGKLHATEAAGALEHLLMRPLADQEISTARACAEALGEIGQASSVDALIYGLFLNIRQQNAFPHCGRALARVGPAAAVPKLIETLQGHNQSVEHLMTEYRNVPGAPAVPDGQVKSVACDVLRTFASPAAIDPLIATLTNRTENTNVRGAAGEALAFTALGSPPERARIVAALMQVANEQPDPGRDGWTLPTVAPQFALLGEPSSVVLMTAALNNRALAPEDHAGIRVEQLLPLASLVRHGDVATFDALAAKARADLMSFMGHNEGSEEEIRPVIASLDKLVPIVNVARECNDGDLACYGRKLQDTNPMVVRKAAYLVAWTTPEAQRDAARTMLLDRLVNPDPLVRRSLIVSIDALTPHASAPTITRLTQFIDSERGQESRIYSHLEAQLLIDRLRARPAGA